MDVESSRAKMIGQQVRAWDVLNAAVLEVLGTVPREHFVPSRYRKLAFSEFQVPLGHGEAMMEPKVEGRVLQALALRSNDRVLEVGTGSGFLTACLARLATSVESHEILPDLAQQARKRLETLGIRNATVSERDASRLSAELGRFDAIAVTGSLPAHEPSFQQHLTVGGRLFVVVGRSPLMEALLVTRVDETAFTRETLFETDLAPLRNLMPVTRFQL